MLIQTYGKLIQNIIKFIGIEENKIPITQEQIDKRLKEQKL